MTGRLKRVGRKQAKANRDNRLWRRDFVLEKPFCMCCGGKQWDNMSTHKIHALHVHEISNGQRRQRGLAKREACLVACDYCNCHKLTDKKEWPLARQLALKAIHDKDYYSLEAIREVFNNGRNPVVVTESDVLLEIARMRTLSEPAKVIAKCDKCGRKYVWINPKYTHDNPCRCLSMNCSGFVRRLQHTGAKP